MKVHLVVIAGSQDDRVLSIRAAGRQERERCKRQIRQLGRPNL